ncbi:MAG: DUF5688 family protein [Lachnospiraceae bacterium]|nr:DUF5688 family protein [Lachnospiraceae bacterium]
MTTTITREQVATKLQGMGLEADLTTTIKNGIELNTITIGSLDSTVRPVIYIDEIIEKAEADEEDIDHVVGRIVKLYNENKAPDINVDLLSDRDYILDNIMVAVERSCEAGDFVRRPSRFEGIDEYLLVTMDLGSGETGSVRVSKAMLASAGITEDEAYERADANNTENAEIQSLFGVIKELLPEDEMASLELPEVHGSNEPLVVSNKAKCKGAGVILNQTVLDNLFAHFGKNEFLMIPSSIHEVLAVPYDGSPLEFFNGMVREVNSTKVRPEEQLADQAYLVTR